MIVNLSQWDGVCKRGYENFILHQHFSIAALFLFCRQFYKYKYWLNSAIDLLLIHRRPLYPLARTSLLVCCIHGSANTHRSTLAYRIGKSPTSCNYSNTDVIVTTRRSSTMPGRIRSHNALSILIKLNTEQSHVFALRMGLLHCNSNVCVYVRAPGIG